MAQVPTIDAPSVAPNASPTPGQHIDTPAGAFGANVLGQGAEDLGKAAGETSDLLAQHATQLYAIYNKQAADQAGFDTAQKIDKMAEDFKTNNTEMQAVKNYPDFVSQVQAVRDTGGNNLSTLAKVDYDSLSRRYTYGALSQIGSYSAEQGNKARIDSSDALAGQVAHNFATNPTPENESLMLETLGKAAQQILGPAGLPADDPQVKQLILKWSSPAYATAISNKYASGDLAGANQLLDQKRDMLTDEAYEKLSNGLRTANHANTINTGADTLLAGGDYILPGKAGAPALPPGVDITQGYAAKVAAEATRQGVDPVLAVAVAYRESKLNPDIKDSPKGAIGGMQLLSTTAAQLGVDPRDPDQNIRGGVTYLKQQLAHFGNSPSLAAAAYNAGPGAVDRYSGVPPYKETQDYVNAVVPGGQRGTSIHFDPIMTPTASTDPELYIATVDKELENRVKIAAPKDAATQEQLFSASHQRAMIVKQGLQAAQSASYDKMDNWLANNPNSSITDVQTQFPTDWGNAPGKYKTALTRQASQSANQETDARLDNRLKLAGELAGAATNPNPFLNEDIRNLDLTRGDLVKYSTAQTQLANGAKPSESIASIAARSLEGKAALNALQMQDNDPATFASHSAQFTGALQQEVENWQHLNPGKNPLEPDLHRMLMNVVATNGPHFTGRKPDGKTPAFEVPPAEAQTIRQRLAARGLGATDLDIGKVYWGANAR